MDEHIGVGGQRDEIVAAHSVAADDNTTPIDLKAVAETWPLLLCETKMMPVLDSSRSDQPVIVAIGLA